MQPLVLTIRAISTEFARRLAIPVGVLLGIILIAAISATAWLITISAWWWILMVLLIAASVVSILVAIIIGALLNALNPTQTKSQKKSVKAFVDKLQEVSDTVQTPKIILLGRVVWDAARKNENGLVRTMSSHSTTTKRDFDAIQKSFKK